MASPHRLWVSREQCFKRWKESWLVATETAYQTVIIMFVKTQFSSALFGSLPPLLRIASGDIGGIPSSPPMGVPRLNYPFPTVIVLGSLNFSERPFIISIPAIKYGAFASKALRSTALPPPCMSVICMNIAFLHLTCNEGRFQTALSLLYADCARFILNH